MNLIPSFSTWQFAVAGAVCAAGPVIIHLLNRRRFRVVNWAAMDFLREALQRNRRILQMRDLLLLLLRTLAVLLVGLALAHPFLSRTDEAFDGSKPLHAVLVIDNSMSMGYESLEGTLLDHAKARAKQFADQLPTDSRISVIPLCGSRFGYSPDAFTIEDGLEYLDRIEVVDRSASVPRAVNEARKACETGPSLGKRVVLFSDQQASNWRDLAGSDLFSDLPSVQVVDLSPAISENTWISDFLVQDGVADVDTPTTFIAEVRHDGNAPRRDVQVTLSIDDVEVASKTVSLEPGMGAREVAFEYVFTNQRPDPGRPIFVPARVSISPDRLPADDQRHLVVAVVAALPVVFVDQYGEEDENAIKNRLGETRPLRRLLAPVTSRTESPRQLVKIRHIKLAQLDQATIEDARLVVMAGIADPGQAVPLLREYVQQGGQLVIAAGGQYDPAINAGFDPVRWNDSAWLDGEGILPAPLRSEPLGTTPDEATSEIKPFFLSYPSMATHSYFQLAGVGEDQLRDLYAEPFFFKAVQTDITADGMQALHDAEVARLRNKHQFLDEAARRRRAYAELANQGDPGGSDERSLQDDMERLEQLLPDWLLWSNQSVDETEEVLPDDPQQRERRLADLASRALPVVLARFDDQAHTPFLVERSIGRGKVLFISTGLVSDWNTLPATNAILIFDRILRSMVQSTLPQRNFPPRERISLPLPDRDREATVELQRPGPQGETEMLDAGFVGKDQLGVDIQRPLARGLYRVTAYRNGESQTDQPREMLWQVPLAVNGDAIESELIPLDRDRFEQHVDATAARWVGPGEEISLAGTQITGQNSWWWLALAVLVLLIIELVALAQPAARVPVGPK